MKKKTIYDLRDEIGGGVVFRAKILTCLNPGCWYNGFVGSWVVVKFPEKHLDSNYVENVGAHEKGSIIWMDDLEIDYDAILTQIERRRQEKEYLDGRNV